MTGEELSVQALNQVITGLRKEVRKAITFSVQNLRQKMKTYRKSAEYNARKKRQADGLLEKIHAVRDIHKKTSLDDVIKFALVNVKNMAELCQEKKDASIDRMALFRVVTAPVMTKAVDKVRHRYPNWHQEIPFLLQRFGQQSKQKRLEKAEKTAASDKKNIVKASNTAKKSAEKEKVAKEEEKAEDEESEESDEQPAINVKSAAKKKVEAIGRKSTVQTEEETSNDDDDEEEGAESDKNEDAMEDSDDESAEDDYAVEDSDDEGAENDEAVIEDSDEEEEENDVEEFKDEEPLSVPPKRFKPRETAQRKPVAGAAKKSAAKDENDDKSEDEFFTSAGVSKSKAKDDKKSKQFDRPPNKNRDSGRCNGPPNKNRDSSRFNGPPNKNRDSSRFNGPPNKNRDSSRFNGPPNKNRDSSRFNGPPNKRFDKNDQRRGSFGDSQPAGSRLEQPRKRAVERGGGDGLALHPSWEAAKRKKEQIQAALSRNSSTKHIKFDN